MSDKAQTYLSTSDVDRLLDTAMTGDPDDPTTFIALAAVMSETLSRLDEAVGIAFHSDDTFDVIKARAGEVWGSLDAVTDIVAMRRALGAIARRVNALLEAFDAKA